MTTLIVLVLAVATAAAAATGTVRGTVSLRGTPVVNARIVIESESDSSYGAVAYTDKEGRFTFANAPVGPVIVKAHDASGAVAGTAKGTLNEQDEILVLQIELAP